MHGAPKPPTGSLSHAVATAATMHPVPGIIRLAAGWLPVPFCTAAPWFPLGPRLLGGAPAAEEGAPAAEGGPTEGRGAWATGLRLGGPMVSAWSGLVATKAQPGSSRMQADAYTCVMLCEGCGVGAGVGEGGGAGGDLGL